MAENSTALVVAALVLTSLAPNALAAASAQAGASAAHSTSNGFSFDRPSEKGLYRVRVTPAEVPIPLNRLQDWRLVVEHNGEPVEGATVTVGGGMPLHFHGFPTKPVVGTNSGGGYVIRGIKFSMRGWWQVKLVIDGPAGSDRVTYNVRL